MSFFTQTPGPCALLALAGALLACSPGLNWREVRPEHAGLSLLFPCKPEVESRPLRAASTGQPALEMGLAVCMAEGARFSLAWADVDEPAKLAPALAQMRASLATKLHARAEPAQALALAGMTPNAEAMAQALRGGRAEGRDVQAEVAVFARGLRVYQLVRLGPQAGGPAWESFLNSVNLQER
ncbi:hypothetical protein [Paucibacter soli]|uniref:hypothetical protein n=1 Tax=Paucibacter soli TaxID=3133433 RepID=UPI0030A49988